MAEMVNFPQPLPPHPPDIGGQERSRMSATNKEKWYNAETNIVGGGRIQPKNLLALARRAPTEKY